MVALLSFLLISATSFAADAGGAAEYEQAGTRSPAEKLNFATEAESEIQGHIEHVQAQLETAQKNRQQDVIECLSRKLQPMQTLAAVVKGDAASLRAAPAGSTEGDALFRKIAVALGKVRDFRADADACVGDAGADQGIQVASMSEPLSEVDVDDLIDEPWEDEDGNPPDPSPN